MGSPLSRRCVLFCTRRSCGKEIVMDLNHLRYSCNECGSEEIELISGNQFRITSIEIQ